MRNYIILNGVNSNTITGLLISTLPPITKPKIRTQTEEIDGRDGDIVTKLGYSAYDKEIEIGLYGNFDINEVIAYFNTEGTIVFSNEADKYYNYQILDQIDYEKLIRFKTAKVKMHVQPFKYPLEETPVEINIQNVTGEGETTSLDNTAEAPLTLALKGNTSQDGTPTPEAPVEVQTVTGRQEIIISNGTDTQGYELDLGKSLYGGFTYSVTSYGISYKYNNDGTIEANGTSTGNALSMISSVARDNGYLKTLNAGTYTISGGGTNYIIEVINNTGTLVASTTSQETTKTFTISTLTNVFVRLNISNGITVNNIVAKIMLEKGSEATDYAPYKTPIEVCKIGDYQDYFYKDNNKWFIKREIGKVVLDGSEDWVLRNTGDGTTTVSFNHNMSGLINTQLYCDRFIRSWSSTDGNEGIAIPTQLIHIYIQIKRSRLSSLDVSGLKSWLSANNVTFYYVLKDPEDEEITDNTLIGQLNALENARSYDTTTNINQNTPNKPFIINAIAVQKGSDTGNVDNIGNIYAKPTIDIEGSGIVEIYLDGNQIFNVDLSTINECVIDTTNLEAYDPSTTQLMNRQVTGDYSNFKINTGDNEVKVSGNVTKATISNYTRWL